MKNYKKQLVIGVSTVFLGVLAGCTHKAPEPVIKPTMTLAKKQSMYKKRLANRGVQVVQVGQTVQVVLPSDKLFHPNSANIRTAQRSTLDNVAGLIKTYDVVGINVAGYSDNQKYPAAPAGRKKALTKRQAQSVSAYLWSKKLDVRFSAAEGYGGKDPIAFNSNVQGKAFNRRVTVSFRFYPLVKKYN